MASPWSLTFQMLRCRRPCGGEGSQVHDEEEEEEWVVTASHLQQQQQQPTHPPIASQPRAQTQQQQPNRKKFITVADMRDFLRYEREEEEDCRRRRQEPSLLRRDRRIRPRARLRPNNDDAATEDEKRRTTVDYTETRHPASLSFRKSWRQNSSSFLDPAYDDDDNVAAEPLTPKQKPKRRSLSLKHWEQEPIYPTSPLASKALDWMDNDDDDDDDSLTLDVDFCLVKRRSSTCLHNKLSIIAPPALEEDGDNDNGSNNSRNRPAYVARRKRLARLDNNNREEEDPKDTATTATEDESFLSSSLSSSESDDYDGNHHNQVTEATVTAPEAAYPTSKDRHHKVDQEDVSSTDVASSNHNNDTNVSLSSYLELLLDGPSWLLPMM